MRQRTTFAINLPQKSNGLQKASNDIMPFKEKIISKWIGALKIVSIWGMNVTHWFAMSDWFVHTLQNYRAPWVAGFLIEI